MHYIDICKKAKEDMEKLMEMMHEHEVDGVEIPTEMKIDFMTNCMLCNKALMEDTWVPYNENVYGAEYPDSYHELRHGGKRDNRMVSDEDMKHWVSKMRNQDGTVGAHWTMEDTTAVGKKHGLDFSEVSETCFYVLLNMKYSDHYETAKKYGLHSSPDFFVSLAMDAINDDDTVPIDEKLKMYYKYIVKK